MGSVTPYLLYEDVAGAIDWLERAFGFRERLRFAEDDGTVSHAEMTIGNGEIMLGDPGPEYRNPGRLGGVTVMLHVYVDDVDAHCAQAKSAGAMIIREPEDKEYGDRSYLAADPEGHNWMFGQRLRDVEPPEWGATAAP